MTPGQDPETNRKQRGNVKTELGREERGSQVLVCLAASGQQEEDAKLLISFGCRGQGGSWGQLGEPQLQPLLDLG